MRAIKKIKEREKNVISYDYLLELETLNLYWKKKGEGEDKHI